MSIPDYQSLMLPLMELLSDGKVRTLRECADALAERFGLTEEDRKKLLPSGQQAVFDNRVGWAKTYLAKAGLLESPKRGLVRITSRGKDILAERPERIDVGFLARFPEFKEFRSRRRGDKVTDGSESEDRAEASPTERMEAAFSEYQDALVEDLLAEVRRVSPAFFERLVVRLLLSMGYGGGLHQAGQVVGRPSDEGIDGVINEDKLGLEVIYIQAKQWAQPVGRPEVQKFVGALHGKRAKKGVFITTSSFTAEAQKYVESIEPKVVLVDGNKLARLMIEHNVGVSTRAAYELKSVDRDFFDETG